MIPLFIAMRIDVTGFLKAPKRVINKATKHTLAFVSRVWHTRFRPKHFTPEGAREYRYRRRTEAYNLRKQRRFGHRRPLVFTGESMALSRIRDIRATSKQARVVIRAPKLNLRPRGVTGKTPRQEMETVSTREERELLRLAGPVMEAAIVQLGGERKAG